MSRSTILWRLEHTLADVRDERFTSAVPSDDVMLYHALLAQGRVTYVTDYEPGHVAHWINVHLGNSSPRILGTSMADAIHSTRHSGYGVAGVVTPDPVEAAEVIRLGCVAWLVVSPRYTRQEFRPDTVPGVKAWEDLKTEVEQQKILKASDTRTDQESLDGRYTD